MRMVVVRIKTIPTECRYGNGTLDPGTRASGLIEALMIRKTKPKAAQIELRIRIKLLDVPAPYFSSLLEMMYV
jgi:hypothetical protein